MKWNASVYLGSTLVNILRKEESLDSKTLYGKDSKFSAFLDVKEVYIPKCSEAKSVRPRYYGAAIKKG